MGTNKKRENIFHFKQFAITNRHSAMKVGTDGVLLGAWCNISDAKTILDIGTGTGLIALMAAQRNHNAHISGIEIDFDTAQEAKLNARISPWGERINIIHGDFIYMAQSNKFQKVDHIISNPPYFASTITAPDQKRALARHGTTLNYSSLIASASQLLLPSGKLSIISPYDRYDDIIFSSSLYHLNISRITEVFSTPQSGPTRILWEFIQEQTTVKKTTLIIQSAPKIYTPEYIALTHDFYLKM